MTLISKWRQHIEEWQRSGLSQTTYCAEQQINVRTFTARLSDYRKLPRSDSAALIPVPMNPLAALDQLNLEPAAKTQVAAMIQALLEQAAQDAQTIAKKGASLQAKDVKIAALTYELAYYKHAVIFIAAGS